MTPACGRRLLGLLAATALLSAVSPAAILAEPRPLEITARTIDHFRIGETATTFGPLEFLGGLVLTSEDDDFGSLSGLDFDASGRLVAVTDRGMWVTAELLETADGKPLGLRAARIGQMLEPADAAPSRSKNDAESVRAATLGGKSSLLVSFEIRHEVWRYPDPLDMAATPKRLALPAFVDGLKSNKSLEALAVAPETGPLGGAVVVIAERSLDRAGNHRGFVLDGPRRGTFTIGRSQSFDITDATFLPDGDLLILERRFSYRTGVALRMRLIRSTLIRPGAVVDGSTLIEANMAYQIDNLEGLALRTDEAGRTIVTLVSDDNHSLLQRTLLLQFALTRPTVPLPKLRPVDLSG